jgi:general secretion pathway protein A
MYERFYNLRERPFALSPDPEYLYPSRVHQEALDYLRYGVESQAGFIVITGEIGSGKTTLLQTLLRNLDNDTTVGRIVNTMLDPRELLETIMIDFGLEPMGHSKPLMLRDLSQYLVSQRIAGRLVLLVIDEAQNLSLGSLEELRMLSNLETEKSKLLQIVLVGQPTLRDKLAAPELEQLRQRITVSYHLPPLDADETGKYINHRLHRAAIGSPMEFPRSATDMIHARSRGVPRIINVICDAALVFGYAEERHAIDDTLIRAVLAELETTGVLPPPRDPADTEDADAPGPSADQVITPPAGNGQPSGRRRRRGKRTATPDSIGVAEAPDAEVIRQLEARVLAVEQREEELRQRERELAHQRRVLLEEYRALRTDQVAASVEAPLPSHVTAAVPSQAPAQVQSPARHTFPAASVQAARFDAAPGESAWERVKRIMLRLSVS